jgi:hypothetical protein
MLDRIGWKIGSGVVAVVAGIAARALLTRLWEAVGSTEPPLNPADRRLGWPEALSWAVAAGVAAGVARVVGRRLAAAGWQQAVGEPPPGMEAPAG